MLMKRLCVGDATGARSGPLAKWAVYYTAHLALYDIAVSPAFETASDTDDPPLTQASTRSHFETCAALS